MAWQETWDDNVTVKGNLKWWDIDSTGGLFQYVGAFSKLASANTLADEIKNLEEKKSRYMDLKNEICDNLIPDISTAKISVSDARTNLKDSYKGSEESTKLRNRLKDCKSSISEVKSILENTCTSIDTEIANLQTDINSKYESYKSYVNIESSHYTMS